MLDGETSTCHVMSFYSSLCPHARPIAANIYPLQYGAEVSTILYIMMHENINLSLLEMAGGVYSIRPQVAGSSV